MGINLKLYCFEDKKDTRIATATNYRKISLF